MDNVVLSQQLTLGVSLKDEATFANYIPGPNQQLVQELINVTQGLGQHILYFYGIGGLGCTHLLQACCHAAATNHTSIIYLPMSMRHELSIEIFQGLENFSIVCIDDIHLLSGHPEWEEAFFHAYNRLQEVGSKLIITANALPKQVNINLPDVVSRLSSGVIFQLQALSDEEKLAALIFRAEQRGMHLSEEVGKYILNHCPRHMATLFSALNVLDKVSLAAQRRLTIPFVKAVLQI